MNEAYSIVVNVLTDWEIPFRCNVEHKREIAVHIIMELVNSLTYGRTSNDLEAYTHNDILIMLEANFNLICVIYRKLVQTEIVTVRKIPVTDMIRNNVWESLYDAGMFAL